MTLSVFHIFICWECLYETPPPIPPPLSKPKMYFILFKAAWYIYVNFKRKKNNIFTYFQFPISTGTKWHKWCLEKNKYCWGQVEQFRIMQHFCVCLWLQCLPLKFPPSQDVNNVSNVHNIHFMHVQYPFSTYSGSN